MKDLEEIFIAAENIRKERERFFKKMRYADINYKSEFEKQEHEHLIAIEKINYEHQQALTAIKSQMKNRIDNYNQIKNSLNQYAESVNQWCSNIVLSDYTPNPSRINERELDTLIRMIQEQGIKAWIKRTFRIGGYASRLEMARELHQKIEDAGAYCNERISEIKTETEIETDKLIEKQKQKMKKEDEQFARKRKEIYDFQRNEKSQAESGLRKFDTSEELENLRYKIEAMNKFVYKSYGLWGNYSVPNEMPKQLFLGESQLILPNIYGNEEIIKIPVWLDLFECNIIVITLNNSNILSADSKERLFVRRLLARMLKKIPPENCCYSIFDPLFKGASLGQILDITNAGTTDLNFDVFTSNESDVQVVSCSERRKYLRGRLSEILKFIAGRRETLFEYNKKFETFEVPFNWYIDFNFTNISDKKQQEDLKELFANAAAAGYSFIFITTSDGFHIIEELARCYANIQTLHIDLENSICKRGDFQVTFKDCDFPSLDQIYNFTMAIKKYYDDDSIIDNHIASVFTDKGIMLRDATNKLTIPMALDRRGRLVDLELGGEGSVHGFIAGGTNCGKSTLLHTIIVSACMHYHPMDIEIWLVDYKKMEFYFYKKEKFPHIKLIGVSKTEDFTFSLIDKIEYEAARRTELMNRFNAQNLAEYRKHKGEKGYCNIPRLLIIIDEFHEMSQFVAENIEYKDKLENILREYRAQGINCLMADQTFSTGLRGLTPAAQNQIGLRIAMRNEVSLQEIKDILQVDRALYSDSMLHTITTMGQGEFIMKVLVKNNRGEVTDIKLEKFKGLLTRGEDIAPISKALRSIYKGMYKEELLYVNTEEQVPWDDSEPEKLDLEDPVRHSYVRLYLGHSATLKPCFALDMGRQPNENLAIVGGSACQRWELITSIIHSCQYKGYKLIVFMAQYSDLMNDFGMDIREICGLVPGAELFETLDKWCEKLSELESVIDKQIQRDEDIICVFLGLEVANTEFERYHNKFGKGSFRDLISREIQNISAEDEHGVASSVGSKTVFNAKSMIDKLFSDGTRYGIRCVTEVSVYRQFYNIFRNEDMCRHKIALEMSADDCRNYIGNGNFQKYIGKNAIYCDGSREIKKLIPYKLFRVN